MDEEAAAKHRTVVKRAVNGESGPRNYVFVVNIGGEANNALLLGLKPGEELQHRIGPIDMATDGVLTGEHALGKSLANNNDGLFRLGVEVVEIATR